MTYDKPTCGVCGVPVEQMSTERTFEDEKLGKVTFVVRCHGAVERHTVSSEFLNVDPQALRSGVAFERKGLPGLAAGDARAAGGGMLRSPEETDGR